MAFLNSENKLNLTRFLVTFLTNNFIDYFLVQHPYRKVYLVGGLEPRSDPFVISY